LQLSPDSSDEASSEIVLENYPVVDLPLEPRPVTPKTASMRLAILLFRGLFAFVAVVIITMIVSMRGGELIDFSCKTTTTRTGGSMLLMHAGGGHKTSETTYETVIREFHVPLPAALGRLLVDTSRCS
jgi:hypothetical protein